MGVIGVYTPATNFRIRSVFLGDSGFDTNVKRQSIFWEFRNANYYHALAISDYKLSYIVETNTGGGVWLRKELDIDLFGVGIEAYCYYKDAVTDITIDTVWDFTDQQLRIYVDGYLLKLMTQLNPINIIAINQTMTLSTGLEPAFDSFSGTITVTYAATNLPATTTTDPTPKVYIKKDYHPLYSPGSGNWLPVPDTLLQMQAWPSIKADPSANFSIGVAYNIQYLAGSNGGYPIPANIVNKAVVMQAYLSNVFRYDIRVIHGHLQTFVDDDYPDPNSLDRALIALANANPQVKASFATALAQMKVPPSLGVKPNLATLPYGTPNSALDGIRETYYQQVLKLLSLMTRPIDSEIEDDENLNHMISSAATSLQKSIQYTTWINWMLGKMRAQLPPWQQDYVYDIFDLWRAVNQNDLQIGTIVNVNTTGKASMSMYPYFAQYTWKQVSNKRGLYIALKSKISENLAGINRNDYFVGPGFDKTEELIVRPGPWLGMLKCLEVIGNDKFTWGSFTPFNGFFQNDKQLIWPAFGPPAVKAVCSRPDIRAILDNGVLLPGDVLEFPSNPLSQPMFLFDCGNKLVLILVKKWLNDYIIVAYYVRPSNRDYQGKEKTVTFNLEGTDVTVTARWQGSLYKYSNSVLEHFDDWHEESEWNWWANSVIITNNGNDMAGINDMGNGIGFLYQVAKDGTTILSTEFNNIDGMRTMRELAVIDGPMAFNRSSTGIIHITSVAGAGTIDDVVVDGNSLLASPYSVGTSNPTTEAEGLAAAINGYTPSAGYVYKAFNIGGDVYLQSPLAAGAATNGLNITVTVSTNTIVTSTESFHDGSTATNTDYDELSGRRYFLNSDYNSQRVPDTVPAVRTSLLYAIEITKYVNMKGLQGGMPSKALSIVNDALINTDRNAAMVNMQVLGEGSAADVLVYIAPDGYVEGDLIFLKNADGANTITVESAPITTSPSFYKNIFLANNIACTLSNTLGKLVLQYQYDELLGGGIFVEILRQFSSTGGCVFWTGTRAEAEIIRAAGQLIPCNRYELTDKKVILYAERNNVFAKTASYVAVYGGSGKVAGTQHEYCQYDFAGDKVNVRYEEGVIDGNVRGNYVQHDQYELTDVWKFGNISWCRNTAINSYLPGNGAPETIEVQDNYIINANVPATMLAFKKNYIKECDSIGGTNVDMQNCEIINSSNFVLGTNSVFTKCNFQFACSLVFFGGVTIDSCSFLNMPKNFSFNVNRSYTNKQYDDKHSTFDVALSPTETGDLLLGTDSICGIIKPSSPVPLDTIEQICTADGDYSLCYHNIIIQPTDLTQTIVDITNATLSANPNIILSAALVATGIVLNGIKGDWAEFEFDSDIASPTYQKYIYVTHQNY